MWGVVLKTREEEMGRISDGVERTGPDRTGWDHVKARCGKTGWDGTGQGWAEASLSGARQEMWGKNMMTGTKSASEVANLMKQICEERMLVFICLFCDKCGKLNCWQQMLYCSHKYTTVGSGDSVCLLLWTKRLKKTKNNVCRLWILSNVPTLSVTLSPEHHLFLLA